MFDIINRGTHEFSEVSSKEPFLQNFGRRVLLISYDVIQEHMAGPGIRYHHLAQMLASHFKLTVAIPNTQRSILTAQSPPQSSLRYEYVLYDRKDWEPLRPFAEQAEIIIFPIDAASDFPQLAELDAALVVDCYNPHVAEWLAMEGSELLDSDGSQWQRRLDLLKPGYKAGDFFICATERQRDRLLGLLEAAGRINPQTYLDDPSLHRLIDLVPNGLPEDPPQATHPVVKGVWPGIRADDKVLLWGGGLWSWLDPLTAIRSTAQICEKRQDVRLIFPGTRHPNPHLRDIRSQFRPAVALAKELNLLDRAVFFRDWVSYADWTNVLLESDIALNLHHHTIETRLAFRSRILDYFWARRPIITTRGDVLSDLVRTYKLGTVLDYGDVDGLTEAVLLLLDEPDLVSPDAFDEVYDSLQWRKTTSALLQFCHNPRKAPDKPMLIKQHQLDSSRNTHQETAELEAELADAYRDLAQLEVVNAQNQALLNAYEEGRFIRLMRHIHMIREFLNSLLLRIKL